MFLVFGSVISLNIQDNIIHPVSLALELSVTVCAVSFILLVAEEVYNSQVLSTCPLHTNNECGKERRILVGPW